MHLETKETNLVDRPISSLGVIVLLTPASRLLVDLLIHVGHAFVFFHQVCAIVMEIFNRDCLAVSPSALLSNQNP